MLFVNLGLPGLIGDWFVGVSVIDFFVGPAVRTEAAFKFFKEPKEQAFLLSPCISADRAAETPPGPGLIFLGNHFVRWSFCLAAGGAVGALFRLAIRQRRE